MTVTTRHPTQRETQTSPRATPARLVLAVPVAPPDTIEKLRADADEIVCLATPEAFWAISVFYDSFPQRADSEVSALMEQADDAPKAA